MQAPSIAVLSFLLMAAVLPAQHDMLGVTFTGQSVVFDSRTGTAVTLTTNTLVGQNAMARIGNRLFTTERVPVGLNTFAFHIGTVSPVTGVYTRTLSNTLDFRGLAEHPTNPQLLFGIRQNDPDLLVTVNVSTGAITTIGSTGRNGIQALCLFQGQLLAWDITVGLVRVDQVTGLAADVNPSEPGSGQIQWLSSHRDGRLLAGGTALFVVDPVSGALQAIAQMPALDLRGAEERMPLIEPFGTGCQTGLHVPSVLTGTGGTGPNTTITLESTQHQANRLGVLVIGFTHHSTPAQALPFAIAQVFGTGNCTLYQTLDLLDTRLTDGSGRLSASFNLPAFMAGATFYAQHAVFEQANGGISWSNSVMVKVGF